VGLPLASAVHGIDLSRVCGESCSTTIIELHAMTALPVYIALRERGPLPTEWQHPRSEHVRRSFLNGVKPS
jgi:hypothetical protein